MSHRIDELAKSLAEERIPRRQSFRLIGAALAGAILAPFALGTVRAGPDPCKAFCRCRNRRQQEACLAACHTCGGDTDRLCGNCGSMVCCDVPDAYEQGACINGQCTYWCADGATDCGGFCTSLRDDPYNCGACGNVCSESAPFCYAGTCRCPGVVCGGVCVDVLSDNRNCGGCGQDCGPSYVCAAGSCCNPSVADCFGY